MAPLHPQRGLRFMGELQGMVRLRMCNIEVLKKFYIIWCARHQILQNLEIPMYFNRDISCPWNPFSY